MHAYIKKGNFIIFFILNCRPKLTREFQLESWITNQRLAPSCQTWSKRASPEVATASFKVGPTHKKVSNCLPSGGTVTKNPEQFAKVRSLPVCEGAL